MRNKKNSEEKVAPNLRQLLRDNIIASKTSNFKKYSKEFYSKTIPKNFYRNSKCTSLNHNSKKGFSFSLLKYKPKRLINFKGINIPLPSLGKASIDYSKTFGPEHINNSELKKSNTKKIYNFKTISSNDNKSKIVKLIDNEKFIEFKNVYIVKYAQYSESFSKFHPYKELISDGRKREFENIYSKITRNLELQSHIILGDNDNDSENNNLKTDNKLDTTSPYSTTFTLSNNYINESQNNNFIKIKRNIAGICSDFSSFMIKFINLLFKELKDNKSEIMKLLKINHELELKTNISIKELDDIKTYINKFNINKKIVGEKAKESSIKKIKNNFMRKENQYLLNIYKLQDEIRSLILLLNKNKDYYQKFKEAEKEIDNNKKNNDILKSNFNKELQEKTIQYALEKDKKEELLNKFEELDETVKELKKQNNIKRNQEIEMKAQMLKMKIIIDEKNENILMMNEELEHYIREYNNEKSNHQNTMIALKTLEKRLYKDINEK